MNPLVKKLAATAIALALFGCAEETLAPAPAACYDRRAISSESICELLGEACSDPSGPLPAMSEAVVVVPDAAAMPEGVHSQAAHNNLDLVWHEGRLFFAFRTAESHFADDQVELYVVSTTDQQSWQLETRIALDKDLREPRFLSLDGGLWLYFARLSEVVFSFKPEAMMMTKQIDGCRWTEPVELAPTGAPGFIPWRARNVAGVGYLMGYAGGENVVEITGSNIAVSFLQTHDGEHFEPVAGDGVVLEKGASETDWAFLPDGGLVAVSRNESGDEGAFGSKICRAAAGALDLWTCRNDPRKYDSPLVFRHGETVYLIARRQVANDGKYDLERDDLSFSAQAQEYQIEYWKTPKRCSLWTVDPEALAVDYLMDLPSNGDTCFASAVFLEGDQYLVYNYTSPLDDPDLPWNDGQFGETFIYRLTLTLP